jgi:hypothetical protein
MDMITSRRVFALLGVICFVVLFRCHSVQSPETRTRWTAHSSSIAGPKSIPKPTKPLGSLKPTLDIVVGLDDGNLTEIGDILQDLWAMPSFRYLEKNVHVYVNDANADVRMIKHVLDTPLVKILQNANQEAATYLYHITTNWDRLATHTLFLSATYQNIQHAKGRIVDYFNANTGVLPLSSIETHNCDVDPNDQGPLFTSFEDLYYQVNGEFCRKRIAYAKLGQMIVSATRIRSRDLETYIFLKQALDSMHPHVLYESKQSSFKNEESRLYFRKSVEKSYMMLWGCDDSRIVNSCGGDNRLVARRRIMDKDDDCQCIDFELDEGI